MNPHNPELIILRKGGSRSPLFCFPGAGGEDFVFRDMVCLMPEDQPVCVVRMTGFYENRKAFSIKHLAEVSRRIICGKQGSGPYHLCGYSFGGFVAYEIAAQLANEGHQIGLLALFDAVCPAFKANLSVTESMHFRATYLGDRLRKYGRNLILGRFDEVVMGALALISSRAGQTPWLVLRALFRKLNRPLPEMFQFDPIIVAACQAYTPSTYTQRLVLFRSQERGPEYDIDFEMGWGSCARGGIDVHVIPGSHTRMMAKENAIHIVEKLNKYLDQNSGGAICRFQSTTDA